MSSSVWRVDTATGPGMQKVTTVVTAIKAAGLVETLKGAGPFTVFAPTNDAFDKCMKLAHQTLNLMSLGGMAVAIGLVVDDAIVIVEAIAQQREQGASPRAAATRGTAELAVGDGFHDVSDGDLRTLLDELGTMEAVTSTETEVVLPAPIRREGGT